MTAVDDVDRLIERFQQALGEFVKGNPGQSPRPSCAWRG